MTDWMEPFLEGRCTSRARGDERAPARGTAANAAVEHFNNPATFCGAVGAVELSLVDRRGGPVPFVAVRLGAHGVITDPRAVPDAVAEVPERFTVEPRCGACRSRKAEP